MRSSARPGRKEKLQLQIDRMFRRSLARQVDRIVTFSDDDEIFGQKTIRISNGIDFERSRSKPNCTTSRRRSGCWLWPTSIRGTGSTA